MDSTTAINQLVELRDQLAAIPPKSKPIPDRFWKLIQRGPDDECWHWAGSHSPIGYASYNNPSVPGAPGVHRMLWIHNNGPIPAGHEVNHTCHHAWCVNPSHHNLLTAADNRREGRSNYHASHCRHGHPYDEANLYISPLGVRVCRACNRAAQRRYTARVQDALAQAHRLG